MSSEKVPFKTSFYRSQIVSLTSSAADYLVFFLSKELLGVYYPVASAIGNIVGAYVNFMLGRHWSFQKADGQISKQAIKYILVSASSALWNTAGIILLVEHFGLHENIAKVIIGIIVGLIWNFPLFRYFVFK